MATTIHRCDTHVLAARGNVEWLRQTLDSLAGEPTQVHLIEDYSPGSIGVGRARGFSLGSAPYVSLVDDDDYLLPGAMAQCIDFLDANPGCVGVYTDRKCLFSDGTITERHSGPWNPRKQLVDAGIVTHLRVVRREYVALHLDELQQWPTHDCYVISALLAQHGYWHNLPILGYVKRERRQGESLSQADSTRLTTKDLWRKAVLLASPILLNWKAPVS
jgi:hypothetical protein